MINIGDKSHQNVSPVMSISRIDMSDDPLTMTQWVEAFKNKLPMIQVQDFEKVWAEASLRVNSTYSWKSLMSKLTTSAKSAKHGSVLHTITTSEDPS